MTLAAGTKLGPYEIIAPLGAGGMGEVYRARDPRLGREVAVKVITASYSADPERLRRFEQEARAAGILNHPNITAVYDIGQHEGAPYVVQELLEGETLRGLLGGSPLSPRKTIDHALQIAHGLAAAHEKGIVHRDLKPENLFVTRDGRVKILDFGLAKLTQVAEGGSGTNLPTATAGTEPGLVMGTLGYMSPEQVRGRQADPRSDLFSLGAILYEMLSGKRAFHGDSAADTMSAILREDPPDLSITNQAISPGLERVIRHCLEKNPEQRFHSAHDLAFDLEALSGTSGHAMAATAQARPRKVGRMLAVAGIAALLTAAGFVAGLRLAPGTAAVAPGAGDVRYQRITFRRGNVLYARFTPDGQSVVYSAAWGDRPAEIFLSRIGSPESRSLEIPSANLLAVSSTGELAIQLKRQNVYGTAGGGTLARVALAGGAPREVLEDVGLADWAPDGGSLAALRERDGRSVLEFPIGKEIYSSPWDVTAFRVAPDGRSIALIEDGPQGGRITLVESGGGNRVLVEGALYIDSLAWHPSGREIWFSAVDPERGYELRAVDLAGKSRLIATAPDLDGLHDVGRDGSVLVEREVFTQELQCSIAGGPERNLSWLDRSVIVALAPDGRTLLFRESGEGGGKTGSIYLRSSDGAPAVRLGDGDAFDLSPDGKWALAMVPSGGRKVLTLLPTGPGEPKPIPVGDLAVDGAAFLPPDGRRIAIAAAEPGHPPRGYVIEEGQPPRAVTPEGMLDGAAFSPDGRFIAASGPDGRPFLYPVAGGDPKPIRGLETGETPVQWSADGESLYAARFGEAPLPIIRLNLATGRKETWKEILPADRTGLIRIERFTITPDGRSYAYSFSRVTASDLYVISGLK
jgi:Tol biopolymer transport system component